MCANYGLELPEPERESRVRFREFSPLDLAENEARLRRWREDQPNGARITGRMARNLNPLIHEMRGERELEFGWWWLYVGGAPARYSAFNSRDDKLLRSWHAPFQRRALLPASWYVEKGHRFALPGGEAFGIAAISTPVELPGGERLLSYSMVTRGAVARAATVHERMPLVLPREFHESWLATDRPGDASLLEAALRASQRISAELLVVGQQRGPARASATGGTSQPTLF